MKKTEGTKQQSLGEYLSHLRAAKKLSLRAVEEATEKAISNAYLSQLEKGHISRPHPNILYTLSKVYGVAYEKLMEKAGYIVPTGGPSAPTFAIDDLTPEEDEALLKYLAFLRHKVKSS
jgi:transcriptional regulator with XRE-family HTH domain